MADKKTDNKTGNKTDNKTPPAVPAETGGLGAHPKFGLRWKFTLSIIGLITVIILTFTIFIIIRERRLLQTQIYQIVSREVVNLSNICQQAIGFDDLAIFAAVDELKRPAFFYIKYVYVLKDDGSVIYSFQKARNRKWIPGGSLTKGLGRGLDTRFNEKEVRMKISPDPDDSAGVIYDFSRIIVQGPKKAKIGAVIVGMSDIIIRNEVRNLLYVIIPISLLFLMLSVGGSVVLATITIRPIRELSHGAAIIGQGNLDYKINITTHDELGQLATEFNLMTAMIKEAKDKEIEQRLLDEQLEMARDIQEGLNPMAFYDKGGIQIKGFTRAAKGVGGDYFDYKDIDEKRVGALISDVSGKGVPASLVMVMIRTVFTSYLSRGDVDCARVVRAVNDSLSADFAIDKFATLFFMIYDRSTEELSFTNAGHGPLYCYRASSRNCTATKLDGVPIGIMEDVDYKQAKVRLAPGDTVILMTDGITEMRNTAKEEYGLGRAIQQLIANSNLNAKEFVELLVKDVDQFRGEAQPHDDMTALVFKRVL